MQAYEKHRRGTSIGAGQLRVTPRSQEMHSSRHSGLLYLLQQIVGRYAGKNQIMRYAIRQLGKRKQCARLVLVRFAVPHTQHVGPGMRVLLTLRREYGINTVSYIHYPAG